MTNIENDLLAAIKELREASLAMTSGSLPSGTELERFTKALKWSELVIDLAEGKK